MMKPSSTISINGEIFAYVQSRTYESVSIYKSKDLFLRIGQEDVIRKNLNWHQVFLNYGFSVPKIVSEGSIETMHYYTELALKGKKFKDLFSEDCKTERFISEENFQKLLSLSKDYAKNQLKTFQKKNHHTLKDFYFGIHVDSLVAELAHLKIKIEKVFHKIADRTKKMPIVLSHGDFSANNILEDGIIDFERVFYAPAGYDLITNMYHTYNLPKSGDYERIRKYEFSDSHVKEYLSVMDIIYEEHGIPPLSQFVDDFVIARTIFYIARMHSIPKLQQFGYERLEKILDTYLSNGDVVQAITG